MDKVQEERVLKIEISDVLWTEGVRVAILYLSLFWRRIKCCVKAELSNVSFGKYVQTSEPFASRQFSLC